MSDYGNFEDVSVASKSLPFGKKGDKFVGYIDEIKTIMAPGEYGSTGSLIVEMVALEEGEVNKKVDAPDGTSAFETTAIVPGETYTFFANYDQHGKLHRFGKAFEKLEGGNIVQMEVMGFIPSKNPAHKPAKDLKIRVSRKANGEAYVHEDYGKMVDTNTGVDADLEAAAEEFGK